jgi:hypothetical protein
VLEGGLGGLVGELCDVADQVHKRLKLGLDVARREDVLDVLGNGHPTIEELGMDVVGHFLLARAVVVNDISYQKRTQKSTILSI